MAEHSRTYQNKEKRSTRRTAKFTITDALQILQQSLVMCHEAGVVMTVENTERGTVITLEGVDTLKGWLVPRESVPRGEQA
jgi:hypothetical protein